MTKPQEKQKALFEEYVEVTNLQTIWKPTPGDSIEGTIVKRQKSNFGMSFVLETTDGEYLMPNHQMLENLLGLCQIGDNVRVSCGDSVKTNRGNTLTVYKVYIKKAI